MVKVQELWLGIVSRLLLVQIEEQRNSGRKLLHVSVQEQRQQIHDSQKA